MKDILFLSVEHVCAIQKLMLPSAPSSNIGLIEGAVNRVVNQHHYIGGFDLFELAALYLIAIAKAHAFPDANKRTAIQSALLFLEMNDVFIPDNEELVEITVKAAEGAATIQEIANVLKKHYLPL